jgi:hypothetical protein
MVRFYSPKMVMALLAVSPLFSQAEVLGETKTFTSPNGVTEKCIITPRFPMGVYSEADTKKEQKLCAIDFYNETTVLCPKVWSTSPGTIVHDNKDSGKSPSESEATNCGKKSSLKTLAKFKQTMNRNDTSGTYSMSSLLYYHFSRALNTTIDIPVAVYRTMDRKAHYDRVSTKAQPPANAKMNIAGWNAMRSSEENPSFYHPTDDLFVPDLKQIYGVLLRDKGTPYGKEISGVEGTVQSKGFQKTPAYAALNSQQPLRQAMQESIHAAFQDPTLARAFNGVEPSELQMALWMKELTEMVLLDYIFNQQDRTDNIDYRWFWVYEDADKQIQTEEVDSKVSRASMKQIHVPKELQSFHPVLVQKTAIGDNDAGAMPRYLNRTKNAKLLENIHHIHPDTYTRLHYLDADFQKKGPLYQNLVKSYGLKKDVIDHAVANLHAASTVLTQTCLNRELRFDLVDYQDAYRKLFPEVTLDCKNP